MRPPAMVIFERAAALLLPADGSGRVVETEGWEVRAGVGDGSEEAVVWGRPPLASGAGIATILRFAGDRRRALGRLRRRPPGGLRLVDAVWWTPPEIRRTRVKQTVKNALGAGVLLGLSRGGRFDRVLDAAWRDAGGDDRAPAPRPSSGGSLRIDTDASSEVRIFRAGPADTAADPRRAAQALELLEDAGVAKTPALVARGVVAGAGWSLESRLEGERPRDLTDRLVAEAVAFLSALPTDDRPPEAPDEDLVVVRHHLPGAAPEVAELLDRHRHVLKELPSVMRHGDLWAGNLLERDGSLAGIVDWDAWHPYGVPGADLVHLLGGRGIPAGGLGKRFLTRPWRDAAFVEATASYWKASGVSPREEVLDAAGAAWWVGQLAANLHRLPHLATNQDWLDANVHLVLRGV